MLFRSRVLVRPPAIIGAGETSVWNTLRPAEIGAEESQRHVVPDATFAWVHVDDLATLAVDAATGVLPESGAGSSAESGPVEGGCTAINVAGEPATQRHYYEAVTGALGLDPVWDDAPAWSGRFSADRAHAWGWTPTVGLAQAMAEIDAGLRS